VSSGAEWRPIGLLPAIDHCLPRLTERPPAGPGWIHEIKHGGFRILAHRKGRAIRLMSRNGHDLAGRFPQIVEAVRTLPVQSCVIDGEAIVTDDKGLAVFALLREHRHNVGAELCAFDMIELDGEDLRRVPVFGWPTYPRMFDFITGATHRKQRAFIGAIARGVAVKPEPYQRPRQAERAEQ
jgi:ATP dependent DNA ligase domain